MNAGSAVRRIRKALEGLNEGAVVPAGVGERGVLQGVWVALEGLLVGSEVVQEVDGGRAMRPVARVGGVSSSFTASARVKLLDKATPWASPQRREPECA